MRFNILAVICVFLGLAQVFALDDGGFYKISQAGSNKVLTVNSNGAVDGAGIILSEWRNEPSQKWLAVEAVVAGNNYLLLTQQQRWNWGHFLRNGEALRETKDRHNSLPDWSLVLNGDSRGQVTVQPRDGRQYQQWRSEAASSGRVIIKNIQENKCLEAAGVGSQGSQFGGGITTEAPATNPRPGFFRRVRNWFGGLFGSSSSTTTETTTPAPPTTTLSPSFGQGTSATTSNTLTLSVCNKASPGQLWTLDPVSIR